MDFARVTNALDNAEHRRKDIGPRPWESVSNKLKALEMGQVISNEMWDAAARKAEAIGQFQPLLDRYIPMYQQAEQALFDALDGRGIPQGVTLDHLKEKRKILADESARVIKERNDLMKNMAYTEKEQVNKIFFLKKAKQFADQQFWRELAVASTTFLTISEVNGSNKVNQALQDLVKMLFDEPILDRRAKD